MLRISIFITTLLVLPRFLLAEGSVSWEDVTPLLAQNPQIRAYVAATLDVEPAGIGIRLGSQFENLDGQRVAPYAFLAKPKGSDDGFPFELIIQADLRFFDENGQIIAKEAVDDIHLATKLTETLAGVSIRPAPAAEEALKLSPEAAKARTAEIRKLFDEINLREARVNAIEFEDGDLPIEGKAVFHRHPDTSSLELITVDGTLGDHSGFSESFYFSGGELIFVYRQESHWTFHPQNPNSTIDTVKEERYYFQDAQIYQALAKKYEGGGPEKLQAAANAAKNKPLPLSGGEATRFFSRISRLMIARKAEDCVAIYTDVFGGEEGRD